MENTRQRLIDAAVRPLSDNAELKLATTDLLDGMMADSGNDVAETIERWDAIDRRSGRRWAGIVLWAAVAFISAVVFVVEFREIRRLSVWAEWASRFNIFAPVPADEPVNRLAATLNERDRLLLFGDLSKEGKAARMEALWRSEPGNPAYFAEYAAAFISENSSLPPDFLTIARRIDPENAWFTYQAAAVEAKDAVKSSKRTGGKRVAGKTVFDSPKTWQILDQGRFDRTLELFREARAQPKFTSYGAELLRKRIPLIPRETFADRIDSIGILGGFSVSSSIRLRLVLDVFAAKAMMLADSKDLAGYTALTGEADHFLRSLCGEKDSTLVDGLIAGVAAAVISENLGHVAEKLDLPDDARRWKAIHSLLKGRADGKYSRKFIVDGKVVPADTRTGFFIGGSIEMVAKQTENQAPITDDDLKPGRLFDHELLSRFFAYALWFLLLPCLIALACHRFCVTTLSRRLSRRMEDLLRVSDRAWIVGLGVLLPVFYVMAINRLTPLGGRGLGVKGTVFLLPLAHFLGLWLLWLVVPVRVVRWRLSKRARCFGFGRSSWFDWLAVAGAAAFVPLIGWALLAGPAADFWQAWVAELVMMDETKRPPSSLLWAALGCAGITLICLAIAVFRTLLSRSDRQFQSAAASSAVVKTFAWMLIVLALAIPAFQAAGQYWFEREKLMKLDPYRPGWSAYEHRVAEQARRELREVLSYGPLEK
ncbi:MAG: hypothetical protein V4689_16040 [Verrucomicrobiota bacterium]